MVFVVDIKSLWFSLKPAGGARGNSLNETSTVCVLSPYFIIFYILMILCINIGQVSLHSVYYLFLAVLVLIVSVITWIISCGASCSADRHSHTSRKPDHHILVVFIFTLLVLCLPFTVFSLFIDFNPLFCGLLSVFCIPSFLRSLKLISDPLLTE